MPDSIKFFIYKSLIHRLTQIMNEEPLPEHNYVIPIVLYGSYASTYQTNYVVLEIRLINQYDSFQQNP